MLSAGDIKFKYSVKTGAAGNSTAQVDPNESLGKYISTTVWNGGVLHDLFDVISGDENAAQQVDYRCVFIHNTSSTNTYYSPVIWISSEVAGGADAAIGIDTTAASDANSASAQALEVANTATAPVGVSFGAPTDKANGLAINDLAPGQVRAIWIRRTATNSAPVTNDGVTLRVEGDTAA